MQPCHSRNTAGCLSGSPSRTLPEWKVAPGAQEAAASRGPLLALISERRWTDIVSTSGQTAEGALAIFHSRLRRKLRKTEHCYPSSFPLPCCGRGADDALVTQMGGDDYGRQAPGTPRPGDLPWPFPIYAPKLDQSTVGFDDP